MIRWRSEWGGAILPGAASGAGVLVLAEGAAATVRPGNRLGGREGQGHRQNV